MPFVAPQMPNFVAVTKDSIHLFLYFVADVSIFKAGQYRQTGAGHAFQPPRAGTPKASDTQLHNSLKFLHFPAMP